MTQSFCRFHPSFCASCLHHKTYPVLLWIPDKEEVSLPGNLSDPFPVVLFSYGYVGMEVLPPQQVPGQTNRSSFLPHQRRTADHLWNPVFLRVFRNDGCSLCVPVRSAARCSSFRVSSCPCIIRTMVISSSLLQLFSSSNVCLSAIVLLLKLFSLYQKTQRIANRQTPQVFRHSAYACKAV